MCTSHRTIERGKMPFSVLRETAIELATADPHVEDGTDGLFLMASVGTLEKLGIPGTKFFLSTNQNLHLELEPMILPEEVPVTAPVGVIVAMGGEEWVVVEVAEGECMWLAPARYIDITR